MGTALAAVLAIAAVGANVACALVCCSLATEHRQAVASLDTTLSAILKNAPSRTGELRAASPAAPASAGMLPPNGMVPPNGQDALLNALAKAGSENEPDFLRRVQIVPAYHDGKVFGFRLFGVTPHSVFAELGIENGDRIEAINGYAMSSPENAMSAYESFRRKNDLVVLLNRRGRAMTLHYGLH